MEDPWVEPRLQCDEPCGGDDVPGFTLFPMSQNAHFIMYASDSGVGAERFLRYKMLTHFDDIPVDRAPGWCRQAGLSR